MLESESPDNLKLIDDGLSTTCSLIACHAAFKSNPDATPKGNPWPGNLVDVFEKGLQVRVVEYEDDEDKDKRFRWNVAKHDAENNTVRWSSVYQKIFVATSLFKKFGDWEAVRAECKATYGGGKSDTYNRWIRAARGLSAPVLEELKKHPHIPGKMIFDNSFLVVSSANMRNRLNDTSAAQALGVFAAYTTEEGREMSVDTFANVVCKGTRLLEVWRSLIEKRFGSLAETSAAFRRLCVHLATLAGLESILTCANAGLNLHGKSEAQQGIPECFQMVRELERCKAGSLPPPVHCPDEAEVHRRVAAEKEAEAARLKAEQEANARQHAAEQEISDHNANMEIDAETEILTLATPLSCAQPAGLSFEQEVMGNVEARMKHLTFASNTQEMSVALNKLVSQDSRLVVLVDCVTTEKVAFNNLIDVAKLAWDQYQQICGAGGADASKFRLVVVLGSRWDLIDKVLNKHNSLWPTWAKLKVMVQQKSYQTRQSQPLDVVLLCPPQEVGKQEPVSLSVSQTKASLTSQCVRMQCADKDCLFREKSQAASVDIDPEDGVDLLGAMLAEGIDIESSGVSADDSTQPAEDALGNPEVQRNGAVALGKLWPYGRTTEWYDKVLDEVGAAHKATTALIISSTAHPCHWVSCLLRPMDTVVFTRRWSDHSKQHGLALGKKLLLEEALGQMKKNMTSVAANGSGLVPCMRLRVPEGEQLLEAHECQQGVAWHDGLNRIMPAAVLDSQSQKLTVIELEKHGITNVACQSGGGRTLKTDKGLAPGAVVCPASSLWFDDWNALQTFLSLPGNAPR